MASPRKRRIKRAAALNVLKGGEGETAPEPAPKPAPVPVPEPVVEKTEKPVKKTVKKKKSLFSKSTEE